MTVIEAHRLRKRFGTTLALDALDFHLENGHILGLVGPNGSGKSSTVNAILGLTKYDGQLRVLGYEPWRDRHSLMRDVSFMADVTVVPSWLRVSQALDYFTGVHPKFDRKRAEASLSRLNLKHSYRVRELSTGMIAQLQIALITAINSKLLVLDDPTANLDFLSRKQFYDSLLDEYLENKPAILIATHQIEEVQHVLTDAIFLVRGKVAFSCDMDEFSSRYTEVTVRPDALAEARSLHPIQERQFVGRTLLLFDSVDRMRLASLGDLQIPTLADVLSAVVSQQSIQTK